MTAIHFKGKCVKKYTKAYCNCFYVYTYHSYNIFFQEYWSQIYKSLGSIHKLAKVSGCSFTGASIWQYENLRHIIKHRGEGIHQSIYGKAGSFRQHVSA